jgi:hypothetical protein
LRSGSRENLQRRALQLNLDVLDANAAAGTGAKIARYVSMTRMRHHVQRSGELDPNMEFCMLILLESKCRLARFSKRY